MFNNILIIGLGLIGASIAQGVFDNRLANHIFAVDFESSVIELAKESGLIKNGDTELLTLLKSGQLTDCECIIIAVPAFAVKSVFDDIDFAIQNQLLPKDIIISDTASTKGNILKDALASFKQLPPNLVLAHPIAGAEKSGFMARNGALFKSHKLIICPHEFNDKTAVNKIAHLWQALGASVDFISCEKHDEILALTSHLPHLLSYALTYQLAKDEESLNIFRYAGGGFRDFSRISASSPIMWHDIFLANKQVVLQGLDEYQKILDELKSDIENDNSDKLLETFAIAKNAREYFGRLLVEKEKLKNG
ncbi:prephenate dehydrogenase/arogenate dehydrogenase family protein [Moraxella oblonga]|uniref:prephenate dehydrogenase/arogenate dehydrogenase family protein n=1 Tax=Moraxella oblonga TaxID=200413 RepID=UPI0008354805|nr:prephenate dehydrogenase/arogenate dehydrogenase family protein [Moraxella oblonga]